MIEIKKAGEVCVLMLRREPAPVGEPPWKKPQMVFEQAEPEDVANAVAAGDPKITGRLKELGWVKVPVESKTMAEAGARPLSEREAGAQLVHAASATLKALRRAAFTTSEDKSIGALIAAINTYTDNVLLPDEEHEALYLRDVAPDEVNEDPKPWFSDLESGHYRVVPVKEYERLVLQGMVRAEREGARRVVHAAIEVMEAYLQKTRFPIALSPLATNLNDAIHDWIDACPYDGESTSTQVFIEQRAIRRIDRENGDQVVSAMAEELMPPSAPLPSGKAFSEALATIFSPKIPPAPKVPSFPEERTLAQRMWCKLWGTDDSAW